MAVSGKQSLPWAIDIHRRFRKPEMFMDGFWKPEMFIGGVGKPATFMGGFWKPEMFIGCVWKPLVCTLAFPGTNDVWAAFAPNSKKTYADPA